MIYIAVIVLGVFWKFFVVTNNVANDFSFLSREELVSRFSLPQIWQERISEGFGQYAVSILWNWPLDLLYGLAGKIGLSFSSIEILLFMIPFAFLGYYSFDRLLNHFDVKGNNRKVGTLFYLLNPYVVLLIDGGQLSIALAYITLPLAIVSFVASMTGSIRDRLITSLIFVGLGVLDIRYLYVLAIILLTYFVYEIFNYPKNSFELTKKWLRASLVIVGVFIVLNSYWIIPSLISREPTLPEGYSNISQVTDLSFTDWKHAVLMQPTGWYKNVFGKISPVDWGFAVFPILVLIGIFLGRKRKETYFFASLILVGVFLTKGSNVPFPHVYGYLFGHVPGFSLFRDSTKFFIFIALGYSYFLSVLVNEIPKYVFKNKNLFRQVPSAVVTIYLLFTIRPVWLGHMTGILSSPTNENEFKNVWTVLDKDAEFGRVLWLPAQAPLGYSSPNHPSVEASRLFSKQPFVTGVVGNYETFNFLREAEYMGELFDILGIKYIVYPFPDTRRDNLKQDNIDYYHAFLDQLTNLPWIEKRLTELPVPILKVINSSDRFFVADNTYIVVGSDSIYENFGVDKFGKLKGNALVFVEEDQGSAVNLPEQSNYILYNKDNLSLVMSKIPADNFIFPAKDLPFSPSNIGWWKRESLDFLWMRNFLQQKYGIDNMDFDYGGGYAISEGENKLRMTNYKFQKEGKLYTRVLISNKGGNVEFYQGNSRVGKIHTKLENTGKIEIKLTGYKEIPDWVSEYDKADFKWFEVGTLVDDGNIEITTQGDINIVNALVVLSESEIAGLENEFGNGETIDSGALTDGEKQELFAGRGDDPVITYKRIAPTYYEVEVSGLTKPSTLVFSETYDPLWRISDKNGNERKPYKLYSLINGFYVDNDGEYKVYFTPQKYVNYGFVISVISFLSISSYLFITNSRKS